MGYIGGRGLALWLMNLYFRILNAGFALPLSAGSANGVMLAPVGINRVYVQLESSLTRVTYDQHRLLFFVRFEFG